MIDIIKVLCDNDVDDVGINCGQRSAVAPRHLRALYKWDIARLISLAYLHYISPFHGQTYSPRPCWLSLAPPGISYKDLFAELLRRCRRGTIHNRTWKIKCIRAYLLYSSAIQPGHAWQPGEISTKDSSLATSPIHSSVVSMRRCSCTIRQRSTATSRSDSSWARSLRSQSAIVGIVECWGCAHDLLPLSWIWMVSYRDAWVNNHNRHSCKVLEKEGMHWACQISIWWYCVWF